MTERSKKPIARPTRSDRPVQAYPPGSEKSQGKLREPTVCPQCGAVFHKGRWTWKAKPIRAQETLCPACQRINHQSPQGLLTVSGPFAIEHQQEILSVIRHEEARAKAEHPLSRIISVEEKGNGMMIATTDTHLPRRIGEALRHAYQGEFSLHYNDDTQFARVTWTR